MNALYVLGGLYLLGYLVTVITSLRDSHRWFVLDMCMVFWTLLLCVFWPIYWLMQGPEIIDNWRHRH